MNQPSTTPAAPKARLGDLLVAYGLVPKERLDLALADAKSKGRKLGRSLVELGFLDEESIAKVVSKQTRVPYVDLSSFKPHAEASKLLPETVARRAMAVPVEPVGREWRVAMADPADVRAYDEVSRHFPNGMRAEVATESAVFSAIDRVYNRGAEIESLASALSKDLVDAGVSLPGADFGADEDAPVARLLQSIFEDAVARKASDVHIEPMEKRVVIRMRVDGGLISQNSADPRIAPAVAQRLKLVSGLDISEKRLPQDGRFHFTARNKRIDARISTSPTVYGEAIVMRLMSGASELQTLDGLGFDPEDLLEYRRALANPNGLVLVTGPTGSGKTTTLYATLGELNRPEHKLVTVEDPVESRIDGICQIQVNDKIDLTFSKALRSILRQDPDVILVGEMRDQETAQTGLRAALTGHLVLSTLHTNDAKSAPARLIDMGAERFMVASSLRLVVAQRLVRLACPSCATAAPIDSHQAVWLEKALGGSRNVQGSPTKGVGCERCAGSGWSGRAAVHEMLTIDDELADLLAHADSKAFLSAAAKRLTGRSLAARAAKLALSGKTSVEEAQRAAGGSF